MPAKKTFLSRERLITLIHVAKGQLNMDDETYRAMLKQVTGHDTCTSLSVQQLEQVLERMKKGGFTVKRKPANSKKAQSPASAHKARKVPADKLRALWIDMHTDGIVTDGSETALDAWVQRTTSQKNGGVGIANVVFLENSPKLMQACIESLKQWQKRVRSQWMNADIKRVSDHQNQHDIDQETAIRELLEQRKIMYWPVFNDIGIKEQTHYAQTRNELTAEANHE